VRTIAIDVHSTHLNTPHCISPTGLLGILAIESVTVAIVLGVLHNQPDHFSLAVVVLIAAAIAIVLYRWHAVGGEFNLTITLRFFFFFFFLSFFFSPHFKP
jgi:hypothetical protein